MAQVVSFILMIILLWAAIGFVAGLLLLGLFRLCDWLSRQTDLPLKYLALIPPLLMFSATQFTSLEFSPYVISIYVYVILTMYLGWEFIFDRLDLPLINRLIGSSLLASITLPFLLITLYALAMSPGLGYYSFDVHNLGGHEIVLIDVEVDGKLIFPVEHSHDHRPTVSLPPGSKVRPEHFKAHFSK